MNNKSFIKELRVRQTSQKEIHQVGGAFCYHYSGAQARSQDFNHGGAQTVTGGASCSCERRRREAPSDLGVWGSVVSSPSGVWGGAPETEAILNIFAKWNTFSALVKSHFFIMT